MKKKEKIASESLTEAEREQVEIVTVELPKDKIRNRVVMYISLAVIVFIGIAALLLWNVPKYKSSDDILKLSRVYSALQQLEKTFPSSIDSEQRFSQATLQNSVLNMRNAINDLQDNRDYFDQFNQYWPELQNVLLNQLPDESLINRLPMIDANVTREISAFITLLENFSIELTQKRNFSLETIRAVDTLVASAYKIDASVVRILSGKSASNVQALAQLSDNVNSLQQGLNQLRNGDPKIGVQSIENSLEVETLNEITFVYEGLSNELGELISNSPELIALKNTQQRLVAYEKDLRKTLQTSLVENFEYDRKMAGKVSYSNTILIVILCLSSFLFFLIYILLKRRITVLNFENLTERDINEKHENAIMSLIDQLEDLGSGDLSLELIVTDDSTGIIADSMNVAIEKLRVMIESVKQSQTNILEQVIENHSIFEKSSELQNWILSERDDLQSKMDNISTKAGVIKKYFNQMTKDEGVLFQFIENKEDSKDNEKLTTIKKIFQMLSKVTLEIEDEVVNLMKKQAIISNNMDNYIDIVNGIKSKNQHFTKYISEMDEAISQFKLPEKNDKLRAEPKLSVL